MTPGLISCQRISTEQGKALADEYGLKFFETSGKEDINVSAVFEWLAADIVERKKHEAAAQDRKNKVNLKDKGGKPDSSACNC